MPATITLTIRHGPLAGKEFVFRERQKCLVGRSASCDLRLPGLEFLTVSRHHCLLEIDPPTLTVRDLGSRNGTYINGMRIDKDPGAQVVGERRELKDGDELKVGEAVLVIHVEPAAEKEGTPRSTIDEQVPLCADVGAFV